MLSQIKTKFLEQEQEWEEDFKKELQRFSKEQLMGLEEENAFADTKDNCGEKTRLSLDHKRSSVVDRLKQSLRDENITFEDVKNILIRDREERERNKMIQKHKEMGQLKRLSLQ